MMRATALSEDEKLAAIFKKHLRVDFDDPYDIPMPGLEQGDRIPSQSEVYAWFRKRVKDMPAFVNEFGTRLDEMGTTPYKKLGKVTDIKIQGDQAVGVVELGGRFLPPRPIHFRRIGEYWHIVLPDPPPLLTPAERAQRLRDSIDSIWIVFACSGPVEYKLQDGVPKFAPQKYVELRLSAKPFAYESSRPTLRLVRIDKTQAGKLIDHWAESGVLARAIESEKQELPRRDLSKKHYSVQITTDELTLSYHLGWGPEMLSELQGLRDVMDGGAAAAMGALIDALDDDRAKWESNIR